MKMKMFFSGIFILFMFSCFSPAFQSIKLKAIKQKMSIIIDSYYKDKDIIDLQPLEDSLYILKDIFIDENNYKYIFEIDGDSNYLEIFNNENLLAKLELKLKIYSNKSDIYLSGNIYDGKFNQFILIWQDPDIDNVNDTNIIFAHAYRDSDEYYYFNIYRTYGNELYSINKHELMPPHLLLEHSIINRYTDEESM